MKVRGGVDVQTESVDVEANAAKEDAKYESQSTTIITKEDIEKKQAKSVEDIIFDETGMTRSVDAMGRVTLSIRGAEPRHTLILVDGQPVMGDFAKYTGAGDELQRLGTENVERIEIIRGAASAKYGADAIGGVVNVVTKAAAKSAGMQVNLEGRRVAGDSKIPYTNFFLRADSGDIGKLRVAAYGGKRDIMPVYGEKTFALSDDTLRRNSLRYYGDIKNIGLLASYEIDKNHSISFGLDHVNEDMDRYVKHSSSFFEPQQHFRRTLDRDTYRLSYTGRAGSSDWQVDLDYAKMNEDDTTLTSYVANRSYIGTNILDYVDNIEHRQWSLKASANTQVNDSHLLTYGLGYTQEKGEGSRLKNAPNSYVRSIDPWGYDKNLYTPKDATSPLSKVHDYKITQNAVGVPKYDNEYEWYGHKDANGRNLVPQFTYEEYLKYKERPSDMPADVAARRDAFGRELMNDPANSYFNGQILTLDGAVSAYYEAETLRESGHTMNWRGKAFQEEYEARQNRQTIGSAEIKKHYIFLQDTWQINKNTILAPILRVDHSNLFGTHATFNIGM
uniref:TonB-dependent receptor plug domain-containing protein n=1 Tax=uncultured Selenomonas sp. TaxID=159275 RepID=UPI00261E9C40